MVVIPIYPHNQTLQPHNCAPSGAVRSLDFGASIINSTSKMCWNWITFSYFCLSNTTLKVWLSLRDMLRDIKNARNAFLCILSQLSLKRVFYVRMVWALSKNWISFRWNSLFGKMPVQKFEDLSDQSFGTKKEPHETVFVMWLQHCQR